MQMVSIHLRVMLTRGDRCAFRTVPEERIERRLRVRTAAVAACGAACAAEVIVIVERRLGGGGTGR